MQSNNKLQDLPAWLIDEMGSVHVTDPFLTSKIPYFVAQIRENPISHREKLVFGALYT